VSLKLYLKGEMIVKSNQKRVVLITGASSGMGKETAKQLLSEGYVVYTAAHRVDKMADLEELGAPAIKMDITNEEDVVNAVEKIKLHHGGVDVLVNNAGFGLYGAMEDTTIDDAKYQFEVNLFGLARLTQAVLPYMREKRTGRIVNITSMGGKIYTPLGSWYHATKHALEGWSDCLRSELAQFGIKVIIIEPGIIKTEFGTTLLGPMMERSGSSAYAEMARAVASATENSYEKGGGSHPAVVSRTVSKALKARKPNTRYVVGKFAKPLIFVRKWFSDRVFDKAIMSQM
jgi:NAD(P)-dependent dehydrogenase (short-subunit alcohol dehydrogenase family)